MDDHYTPDEIRRSKDASVKDGAFWAVMVGTGESSISAFALKLGAGGGAVAFLAAFPQFFGSLLQLASLPLAQRVKSRRWFVALGVFLQAAIWVPMALLALFPLPPAMAIPLVLLLVTLYFSTGMLTYPPWAAWMAELVEENERGRYFAIRNQVSTLLLILSTVLGGWVLTHAGVDVLPAFAILFLLAFVCRAISAGYVARMCERRAEAAPGANASPEFESVDWRAFLSNPALREERRFVLYTGALYAATYIASPLFDVYMLQTLGLDYWVWAIISMAGPLARFLFLPYWGRVIDRFGNRAVMFATGMLVPITPMLWLFSKDPAWLLVFQMVSGVAWSGLELAAFNYVISGRERGIRTAQSSAYTFAKGIGFMLGALVGAGMLLIWPALGAWSGHWIFDGPAGAFLAIFAFSSLARYAVSLYFLPRFSDKTFEGGMSSNEFLWQVFMARPTRGFARHAMQLSDLTLHLAQAGGGAARRAARQGLYLTVYMLKRGPLLIRSKKDKL